jgi:hypothetical protein
VSATASGGSAGDLGYFYDCGDPDIEGPGSQWGAPGDKAESAYAFDATYIYLTNSSPYDFDLDRGVEAGIARYAKDGSAWTVLLPSLVDSDPSVYDSFGPLALDDTHIYFYRRTFANDEVTQSAIMRIPLAGGTPELIRDYPVKPDALAVSDTAIYATFDNYPTCEFELTQIPKP